MICINETEVLRLLNIAMHLSDEDDKNYVIGDIKEIILDEMKKGETMDHVNDPL